MKRAHPRSSRALCFAGFAALIGCGDDGSKDPGSEDGRHTPDAGDASVTQDAGEAPVENDACVAGEHSSTFAAIQAVIFEGRGCTNAMCHGAAVVGGLDLRADAAYDSLIEVTSSNSPFMRVTPGEPDESFLYNKLRAATEPGSVEIEGAPMPSGAPPLSPDHLEVMRRWIEAGAPRDGSIGDSVTGRSDLIGELLGACLPEATPVTIAALAPPEAEEGVQLAMAPFELAGQTEVELCWAQYYDLSDVVPMEFQDPERGVFFVNGQRLRQDPHSHHLVITHSGLDAEAVDDPSFGEWTCRGGEDAGATCDPLELDGCGAGACASEPKPTVACLGYGPSTGVFRPNDGFAGAQTAQFYRAPRDGVYEVLPIRGILYWNSHAYNLTSESTQLHAWLNLLYAKEQRYELQSPAIGTNAVADGQAPFTKETVCATWTAPQSSELYTLGSHTHKRGRNFTVDMADGTRIYTSALYSDPVEKQFDPPLRFDSEDAEERTLTYCAEFNNGVLDDGSPDIDLVTRLSTMPERTTCSPVGCVSGDPGAACNGAEDNAACDSSVGAGDGWCDACSITPGVTTENEMFFLLPSYVSR